MNKTSNGTQASEKKIDWLITLFPLGSILLLCTLFFLFPKRSTAVIASIRFMLGDTFGVYYLALGLAFFLLSIYIAASKYGGIVLGGKDEKPVHSFFSWGAMMFTCGLAADILFYSFAEWMMYAADPHIKEMGGIAEWAPVFPLFHWSFIPWSFYLTLAVSFGFMLHVRGRRRQKYSEACRAILGKHTDGVLGRVIDLLAVFALIAGTATTFSVATPLMASVVNELLGLQLNRIAVTIVILILTCAVYTYSLLHGFKGIGVLAKCCIFMFFGFLAFVLLAGGKTRFIIECGFSSFFRMLSRFIELSTFTDPMRTTSFPQNWTIYYWAYWMVWCVAAPFFIGSISRGRTVRQVITGGYVFGVGSTIVSFVVLGGRSLGMQLSGAKDFLTPYLQSGDIYDAIISMVRSLPLPAFAFVLLLATMTAFYSTSFDTIALTASCYSYHRLSPDAIPSRGIELVWCVLLILLPIALVFSDSSMSALQAVSIIAAFPIGAVMVLIAASFLKDAKGVSAERHLQSAS